jgi:lipid II:glycine glycyltransferase (peptidoglycan interpeptide bridge formation enzyme)
VPSDYKSQPVKTTSQATRLEHEAEDKAREAAKRASDAAHDAKEKAKIQGKKAKSKAKEGGRKLDANKENPVVIANGVILVVGSVALGLGAYKKYSEGTLDWKVAGITAGAVGAFAVADYYASQ